MTPPRWIGAGENLIFKGNFWKPIEILPAPACGSGQVSLPLVAHIAPTPYLRSVQVCPSGE